jgi:hypothetical protein
VAIDTTIGGVDSNSYASLAEGNTYFEGRLHCTDWTNASNPNKEKALIQSARIFDQYVDWLGLKTTTTQALQWPRKGICYDGVHYFNCSSWLTLDADYSWVVDSTTIPQIIKDAQCELSLVLLVDDMQVMGDLSSLSFAGIKMNINGKGNRGIIPDHVWQILSSLGSLKGGTGTVKLLRL